MTSCCDSRSISRARSGSTSVAAAADPLPVGVGHDARGVQRLDGQQLDPQPELEPAPLAEDLAQLGQRIAIDHAQARGSMRSSAPAGLLGAEGGHSLGHAPGPPRARMRAARWAAFFAPPRADRDRGDGHAGRHLDDGVQRVGAAERAAVERDRRSPASPVRLASTPGRWAARPAAPMKSCTPAASASAT